jgi:diguanylate cyclase (GGDEF)-like protein/PAS domain S-box-containing protein
MPDARDDLTAEIQRLKNELLAANARLQAVASACGSLIGNLEFVWTAAAGLLLGRADEMADQLLGKPCTAFLGKSFTALFPTVASSGLADELLRVARQGGALGPASLMGEGLVTGNAFNFLAFQVAVDRVVVKFWDSSGALEAVGLRMRGQQQLAAIFRQSPSAISLSRAADGVYVDVNEEWSGLTGLSLQDVLGRTTVDVGFWVNAQHRSSAMAGMEVEGVLRNHDLYFKRPDGVMLTVQVNVSRIEIGDSVYFLSYVKDVSAERAVAAELLASEQLLKATNLRLHQQIQLFESMEDLAEVGYWTSSAAPDSLRWSKGMYRIAGVETGSVQHRSTARSLIHSDDLPAFVKSREAADGSTLEYRFYHPDGRLHWLRSRIQPWYSDGGDAVYFGVVQDVTTERDASETVRERLEFMQKVMRRAPGMVYQLRLNTDGGFKFLFVSERVRDLYGGVSPEDVMNDATCALRMHHPDDRAAFDTSILESARTLTLWTHEHRLLLANGEVRWLLGQAMPEQEADGSVLWNGFTTDNTARKLAAERLRASEARFRALTELTSDWYWEQDAQFRFVRLDGNFDPTGLRSEQSYIGTLRWEDDIAGVTATQWEDHQAKLAAHQVFHNFEMQRRRVDGTFMWVSISGAPIFDSQGEFTGYRGIGRDISSRRLDEEKIERLAFYDALTGLPNRRLLIDRLQNALAFSAREHLTGALLFIDLDNFKDLNDTQGHDMGDQLLKQVATRLAECVRDADTVARLGGDEFVVMLQKLSVDPIEAAEHAEGVGRKILSTLNQAYRLRGNEFHSTPSIGIALFQDSSLSIDDLLKRADLAMYQAKAAGRNTARFFDPLMQAAATARAAVEADLRQALQRDEFVLYYQQVVNEHHHTTGVEALIRWKHPQRGMVSPAEFIPVAEQTGLILPLGAWVLKAACEQLVAWSANRETQRLTMAVNVSARQFKHPDFTNQILTLLRLTGANPYRLKLELTESLLLTDFDDVIIKMSELRSIGVGFSLDDFGTGYSSLSYLKRLPLDQLKIDQSFVRDVLTDPNDAAIARTILTLAYSLDLGVVAEGVETQGQLNFLIEAGCRSFQGYLFGKPVPVEMLQLDCTTPSQFAPS